MFATELVPGTPLPITLVVHAPSDLRMSAAVGTSPDAVLEVLAAALDQLAAPGRISRVAGPAGRPVLRVDRCESIPVAAEDQVAGTGIDPPTRVLVDYYVPVPDSKQMVMVRLSSPMGVLADLLLDLFDGLVAATYFERERAG
jgi:hypothetical protein